MYKRQEYSISYAKKEPSSTSVNLPKDAGTYVATIAAKDESQKYEGSATQKIEFTITPKSCLDSSIKISISDIEVGNAVSLTVTDGTTTLKQGTDYSIPANSTTALGTNNITLEFQGNYSGTRNFSYEGKYNIAECYEVTLSLIHI